MKSKLWRPGPRRRRPETILKLFGAAEFQLQLPLPGNIPLIPAGHRDLDGFQGPAPQLLEVDRADPVAVADLCHGFLALQPIQDSLRLVCVR
jgi:hypothetical protein